MPRVTYTVQICFNTLAKLPPRMVPTAMWKMLMPESLNFWTSAAVKLSGLENHFAHSEELMMNGLSMSITMAVSLDQLCVLSTSSVSNRISESARD